MRKAVMALGALILLGLIGSWLVGSYMVRAKPSDVKLRGAEAVSLVASDGVHIAGSYWRAAGGEGAPAVLLLHGNGGSRDAVAANAAWLASRGYAAMAIDFRGHGRSDPEPHSFGLNESRDARAAFEWLRRRQQEAPIAIIGISLGGAASLLGEGGPIPADAMVLQAVYPDLRRAIGNRIASITTSWPAELLEPLLSFQTGPRFGRWPSAFAPLARVGDYHGPTLFVGGTEDRYTPPSEVREMFAAAHGPKRIWFAPGADHAVACVLESEAYRAVLLDFLDATIGQSVRKGGSGIASRASLSSLDQRADRSR